MKLLQEKYELGDNHTESCGDTTHVNLETPHYLKEYMDIRSLDFYSWLLKQHAIRKTLNLMPSCRIHYWECRGNPRVQCTSQKSREASWTTWCLTWLKSHGSWQFCQYLTPCLHVAGMYKCLLNENKNMGKGKLRMMRESTVHREKVGK